MSLQSSTPCLFWLNFESSHESWILQLRLVMYEEQEAAKTWKWNCSVEEVNIVEVCLEMSSDYLLNSANLSQFKQSEDLVGIISLPLKMLENLNLESFPLVNLMLSSGKLQFCCELRYTTALRQKRKAQKKDYQFCMLMFMVKAKHPT